MLGVATAIYGEILLIRERLALMAVALCDREIYSTQRELDEQFIIDYPLGEPVLYSALASKLGLMSHDLVLDITRFYENFHITKAYLPLLVKLETRPVPYHSVIVLRPAVEAIYDVRPALRKIERLAGISEAEDPDSGPAPDIVSSFDDDQRRQEEERQIGRNN
jgi:hypothetical protein